MKRLLLFLSLLLPFSLRAAKVPFEFEGEIGPWTTGPLLTPSAHVIPVGHQNYEPYIYWTDIKGVYNNHWHSDSVPHFKTMLSQTAWQFGILPVTELDITTQVLYNNSQGEHDWRVSDQLIALVFQLFKHPYENWRQALKFRVGFNLPFGKYDRLDPRKFGTDVGGAGNWAPSFGFTYSATFHVGREHNLNCRANINYTLTTPIPVHGLSLYGGVPSVNGIKGTRGTVYPGNIFLAQQGFEFTLSANWALALDLMYQHNNRNRFSGRSPPGTKPIFPSSEQFSIAPAIEYNFSGNVGLIAGPWFTVAGRDSNVTFDFISWVFAINIYN